jgi:hypothetical protein
MKSKKKSRAEINDVMDIISADLAEATLLFQRARKAYFAGKEMSWKKVCKVKLEIGQPYFVRRVWLRTKDREQRAELPVLSLWADSGWIDLFRNIHTTTASGTTVEVWCPNKRQ